MKLQVALLIIMVQLTGTWFFIFYFVIADIKINYSFNTCIIIECRVKPRLDQTASFSDFFIKKWNRLARNEKLKEWDTGRTGKNNLELLAHNNRI